MRLTEIRYLTFSTEPKIAIKDPMGTFIDKKQSILYTVPVEMPKGV
ncbi:MULTISPECIES: hypothetical protein [Pseudomonas]|nr:MULTISPECIES: hypothetical protein [Pseudomonas]MBS3184367.1 hypothetical protein [Pseudomonas sp. PCH44]NNA90379.1 hypothetical protein [Pseudomonas gessardii]